MASVDQDIIVFLNQMVVITGSMDLFSPSPPVRDLPAIYRILNDAADQSGVKERILSVLPLDLVDALSTTWQAMHTCMIWYLASRAYPYRFCKLASSVRIAVYYFASSVQIRTCANFCTGSLGTHPKPRNRTLCELRVFCKTLLYVHIVVDDPNEIFYIHFHTDVHF